MDPHGRQKKEKIESVLERERQGGSGAGRGLGQRACRLYIRPATNPSRYEVRWEFRSILQLSSTPTGIFHISHAPMYIKDSHTLHVHIDIPIEERMTPHGRLDGDEAGCDFVLARLVYPTSSGLHGSASHPLSFFIRSCNFASCDEFLRPRMGRLLRYHTLFSFKRAVG